MPRKINNANTHDPTGQLAGVTGEALTEAVGRPTHDRLARAQASCDGTSVTDELDLIALRCASLPRQDERNPNEIVGYDERGVPG